MFTFFKHSSIRSVDILIFIPSAVNTSADPHLDVSALFPCFATVKLFAASTNDIAVDIFKEDFPSPPVPHVSIEFLGILI